MQNSLQQLPQGISGSPHTYYALGDIPLGEWPAVAADAEASGNDTKPKQRVTHLNDKTSRQSAIVVTES